MKIHLVKPGENLWKIARKYKVDAEKLAAVNRHIKDPNNLAPKSKVKIPTEGVPLKPKTPTVKAEAASATFNESINRDNHEPEVGSTRSDESSVYGESSDSSVSNEMLPYPKMSPHMQYQHPMGDMLSEMPYMEGMHENPYHVPFAQTNPYLMPSNIQPGIHPNMYPHMYPEMYPNMYPDMYPDMYPNIAPNIHHPNMQPSVIPYGAMPSAPYPNIYPEQQPQMVNPYMYGPYGYPNVPFSQPQAGVPYHPMNNMYHNPELWDSTEDSGFGQMKPKKHEAKPKKKLK